MSIPIILSYCLFGSFYLFYISLALTNRSLLEDKKYQMNYL